MAVGHLDLMSVMSKYLYLVQLRSFNSILNFYRTGSLHITVRSDDKNKGSQAVGDAKAYGLLVTKKFGPPTGGFFLAPAEG